MKALKGYRILDLTHMLSGPYATMLLGALGAEVIKVEPPEKGEATRQLLAKDPDHSVEGMGAYFLTLGRNKKSVSLDLKSEQGMKLFYRLVEHVDVVVYNFRVGVAQRLGIDYPKLREINPKIISCSISGFGETGPHKNHVSFDIVAQATGGGMSITGHGESPLRSGIPIGDLGGGLMAAIGIQSALLARHSTGEGQHVDISMQDAQVSMLNYMATMYFLSNRQPPAIGNDHFVHVPYGSFPCKDGHIILAIITDSLWERLMKLLDEPELDTEEHKGQPGRFKNKSLIDGKIGEIFQKEDRSYWLKRLADQGVPCAPVNSFHDALKDPHILARDMVVSVPHPSGTMVKQPGNPIKMSAHDDEFKAPPTVGQNTEEVCKDLLGLTEDELQTLRGEGVL